MFRHTLRGPSADTALPIKDSSFHSNTTKLAIGSRSPASSDLTNLMRMNGSIWPPHALRLYMPSHRCRSLVPFVYYHSALDFLGWMATTNKLDLRPGNAKCHRQDRVKFDPSPHCSCFRYVTMSFVGIERYRLELRNAQ